MLRPPPRIRHLILPFLPNRLASLGMTEEEKKKENCNYMTLLRPSPAYEFYPLATVQRRSKKKNSGMEKRKPLAQSDRPEHKETRAKCNVAILFPSCNNARVSNKNPSLPCHLSCDSSPAAARRRERGGFWWVHLQTLETDSLSGCAAPLSSPPLSYTRTILHLHTRERERSPCRHTQTGSSYTLQR